MMLASSAPAVEMAAQSPPLSLHVALHEEKQEEHDKKPQHTPSVSASQRVSVSSSSPSSTPISTRSSRVLVSPPTGGHKPRVSSHAANTLLLSALHRQSTLKRLQTLRGLSNAASQPQPQLQPVVARQLPSRGSQQSTGARLASSSIDDDGQQHCPSYTAIMRVDDALLFYAPTGDDRSQRGYQLMPCMDSRQQQPARGSATALSFGYQFVAGAQREEKEQLLFLTKPTAAQLQELSSSSLTKLEEEMSGTLSSHAPPAEQAESEDEDDSSDAPPTQGGNAGSPHPTAGSSLPSKPVSTRPSRKTSRTSISSLSTASAVVASSAPPAAVSAPLVRPQCLICTTERLVDAWLSECAHLCCGECWVEWLREQSGSDDLTGGVCPECLQELDFEGLKRVVVCDGCAAVCMLGSGLLWTGQDCSHTACKACMDRHNSSSSAVRCPVCATAAADGQRV